jgi:hypothetical protein
MKIFETLKRWKNWLRMQWHYRVTGRVQKHVIEDKETGKKHEFVVEKQIEEVCDHKTIKEIAPTMWQCANPKCEERAYFQIGYKVMLTQPQLVQYLTDLATHLKMDLQDDGHA